MFHPSKNQGILSFGHFFAVGLMLLLCENCLESYGIAS